MTAIGLQDVDGLQTSPYLLDTAKNHIEGKISIDEAEKSLFSYYEERKERNQIEEKPGRQILFLPGSPDCSVRNRLIFPVWNGLVFTED